MSSYPVYISDLEHAKLNAHVFPGEGDTAENEKRAVKRIWTSGSSLRKEYERELKALLEFSKPKYKEAGVFVEFLGWFEDRDSVYLAMEYVPLGDLEDNIPPKADAISELDIRDIASQILEGLKFMHQEAFIHRDLKPKNVLVCRRHPQWWIKLADFGLSKRQTEETAYRTHTGTQAYMAPEVLNYVPGIDPQSSGYTNAIDLWGLGCIIYRLASGVVPFPVGPSLYQYCVKQLAFPSHSLPLSLSGTNFTMDLLRPCPSSRPTAVQALNHIWMSMNGFFIYSLWILKDQQFNV
ncbi:kinase-like domain-containing protein [Bisporella sp. PMI_857]|nr:kinase-like domain-containing protein [Bisporella sp. PMI_857]